MLVAQRGTSTSTSSDFAADGFKFSFGGTDEAPTIAQVDVASGTTPYTLGFQKALRVTNGNQTSGAGAGDWIEYYQYIEDQDISNSGWNFKSATSFITLSFWVKSSVAQKFTGFLYTNQAAEGDSYMYSYQIDNGSGGNLTADTWTKVTHSIQGMSSLTFNNDNTNGLAVGFYMFEGTDYSTSGHTDNTWAQWTTSNKIKDMTSTWYETNDATFEITGVQLEVGSQATAFEHRSFGEELAICQRYYQVLATGNQAIIGNGFAFQTNRFQTSVPLPVEMRTTPTLDERMNSGGTYYRINMGNSDQNTGISPSLSSAVSSNRVANLGWDSLGSNVTNGDGGQVRKQGDSGVLGVTAEL